MREIVHLQAGQCGNQIGSKVSPLHNRSFELMGSAKSEEKSLRNLFPFITQENINVHQMCQRVTHMLTLSLKQAYRKIH